MEGVSALRPSGGSESRDSGDGLGAGAEREDRVDRSGGRVRPESDGERFVLLDGKLLTRLNAAWVAADEEHDREVLDVLLEMERWGTNIGLWIPVQDGWLRARREPDRRAGIIDGVEIAPEDLFGLPVVRIGTKRNEWGAVETAATSNEYWRFMQAFAESAGLFLWAGEEANQLGESSSRDRLARTARKAAHDCRFRTESSLDWLGRSLEPELWYPVLGGYIALLDGNVERVPADAVVYGRLHGGITVVTEFGEREKTG